MIKVYHTHKLVQTLASDGEDIHSKQCQTQMVKYILNN